MAHLLNKTPEFIEQNTSRALQKPQYNKILRKHQKKKKKKINTAIIKELKF